MRFQTFSILAGSEACNARCQFCISKMTPPNGVELKEPEVNWRNFKIAANLAKQSGVLTAMITGKGEPILFPEQITKYLDALKEFNFPFIELQTNGIPIAERKEKFEPFLREWYDKGMTLQAISVVHYDAEKNRAVYTPHREKYIDLPELIDRLHDTGFSVRLACVAIRGGIDSPSELEKIVEFAKQNKVEQLTVRPVNKPEKSRSLQIFDWTAQNGLGEKEVQDMESYLDEKGTKLLEWPYGGKVYDLNGQNICLTNCLTRKNDDEIRQLIFYPDGHLRYDWEKPGAILL